MTTATARQRGPQGGRRGGTGAHPALLGSSRRRMTGQASQELFQLLVALRDRLPVGIVEGDGLLEREQMFLPPIAFERLDDLLFAGADALMPQLGELDRIALAGDDGAHDILAR